jgi:hypothetical protein
MPKSVLLKVIAPITDIINVGEDVEQNALALTLSASLKSPLVFRSETIFAPIG